MGVLAGVIVMFIFYWPIIIVVTGVLYILIIVTLPFNPFYSTIYLFSLIAFWSRLPGVGTASPGHILYTSDLVDLFGLLLAINWGGFEAGMFTVFANFLSRISGIYPPWLVVMRDIIAHFLTCLLMPTVYNMLGQNLYMSMVAYQVIRTFWYFPMYLLPHLHTVTQFLFNLTMMTAGTLFFNSMYIKLFGGFFDNLLAKGVQFSWLLFIFSTIVIFSVKAYLFHSSKSISITKLIVTSSRKLKKKMQTKEQNNVDIEMQQMYIIKKQLEETNT